MIQKIFFIIALFTLLAACEAKQEKDENEQKSENTENSTKESSQIDVPEINISDFETEAAGFVGKEVKVKGIVDHVCKHGGKKLLLVADSANVHVESENRFDENIVGNEMTVKGIVKEFKVDEAYCLKMEEDNIKSHKEGEADDKVFEQKKKQITAYRDSMEKAGVDHLSFYSLEFVSFENSKQ